MIATDPASRSAPSPGGHVHGLGQRQSRAWWWALGPRPWCWPWPTRPTSAICTAIWSTTIRTTRTASWSSRSPCSSCGAGSSRSPGSEPLRGRVGAVVGLGLPRGDPGRAGRRLRAELPVGGDRHRPAGDRLPDLGLRRLAAAAPGLAGHPLPRLHAPPAAAVNDLIALPLQRIAATGSYFLLQLSGFWAIQQGNVLQPDDAASA